MSVVAGFLLGLDDGGLILFRLEIYISSKQCGVIYNRAKAKAKGTHDVFVVLVHEG